MSASNEERTAVLVMAHGSRRSEANDDLVQLADRVRRRGGYAIVEIGYLELAEPTIPQGVEACVARGARQVLMLPFFLSAGSHVREDLGRLRDRFAADYPEVSFRLCPPLGLHPSVVAAVLDRLRESLSETNVS